MKKVLGCIRRADDDFNMIETGDRIAVGLSGGKDSIMLLYAMNLYKRFTHKEFDLGAILIDMGTEGFDISPIRALTDELGIELHVIPTRISEIVFVERQEKNPCSLCARMRRGALNRVANDLKYNKVALGHHREDVLATLLLSLFYEGRLHTFAPVTRLSRTGITAIRPMVYLDEKHIISTVKRIGLPVGQAYCPAGGDTKRHEMEQLLHDISKRFPNAQEYMLSALKNYEQYGLWERDK